MSIALLRNICVVLFLTACSTTAHKAINHTAENNIFNNAPNQEPGSGSIDGQRTEPGDSLAGKQPLNLLELPQTEEGEIVLADGFYEADFKSYCLQPGTPSPSARDAYLQAPLHGYRKDIIATILQNSRKKTYLQQRNIQLLLWSVVSGSNFNRLSKDVQYTASELLSPHQVFELKGGVMGVVRTISSVLPDNTLPGSFRSMQQLFETGNASYEAFERIAVQRELSAISNPALKTDQWYKQQGGYYVRYFPASYQQVKIQVYVAAGGAAAAEKMDHYLLFNPVTMMAVPANSNAQRLGIGAPMLDAIIKIIQIQKGTANPKKQPGNANPKNAKALS